MTPEVNISFDLDPQEIIDELVGMLADGTPLSKLFASLGPEAADLIEEALLQGIAKGESMATIAKHITEAFDMPRWRALTIARTEIMRAFRTATLRTYAQHSDVLEGWYWLATLSTKTCPACWSLHGQFFPLSKQFFPSHVACRCTSAPSIKGSPLNIESGSDAFANLTPEQQLEILGPGRMDLYLRGTPLTEFVMLTRDKDWGSAYVTRPLFSVRKRRAA